ncbi:hypothetical protein LMH87_010026 [Akanthomyces muscarius]|uniref:Zn(2)-C6 fungal-type domain-containing protein n=1 Tax=Akanthomyces muscarius TaxID=2231603 RepID=A0A9W8QD54_AKAMU|nr:hypothetical protein LMH87_010026 [Akanthomyces muscarius]KAJ4153542.1 hypothetical protein LMH87_010026 [Akanthomyces muscarius]
MDLKFGIMSKEHENMASEMKDDEAGRILIACTRCKVRKRRCDGQKPKCRGCATHGWECQYSTIRRTRGRGRRDAQPVPASKTPTSDGGEGLFSFDASHRQVHINRWIPTLPDFLVKANFAQHLQALRASIVSDHHQRDDDDDDDERGRRFTPLPPQAMGTRLIRNSYPHIAASQLLDWPDFVHVLDAQYADKPGQPAARWALVNAVMADAVRFKTAPGAEAVMEPLLRALCRNARMVRTELVCGEASVMAVQALLCMAAVAAKDQQDGGSECGELSMYALQQLQMLRGSKEDDKAECQRACEFADAMSLASC